MWNRIKDTEGKYKYDIDSMIDEQNSEIISSSPSDLFGLKKFKTFLISSMITSNSRVSFSSPFNLLSILVYWCISTVFIPSLSCK
jgi:hypothetical protein